MRVRLSDNPAHAERFARAAAFVPQAAAGAAPADPAAPCDAQALRRLMQGGSKTFFAASLLLPGRVRAPATALYAYCRLADDAIDLGADPHAEMQRLRQRLDAIYAGRPGADQADRALAEVVQRFAIPRALLDGLLEGFLWDAQGRSYETLDEVHDYGARVAGTVGAMMSLVMGTRSASALARACELGVAMQLTNIARDVGEDARNGRLYLPRQWLREEGLDVQAWLRAPQFNPAIARCTQRLLAQADVLYRRAEHGVAELPADCRPAIQSARLVYAEIGRQLERHGLDSVNQRAVVSGRRKLGLIAVATGTAFIAPQGELGDPTPLPAIRFLVDAVAASAPPAGHAARPPRRSFDQRMEWATDLYARLAENDDRGRVLTAGERH
jgi:phytoene synthase